VKDKAELQRLEAPTVGAAALVVLAAAPHVGFQFPPRGECGHSDLLLSCAAAEPAKDISRYEYWCLPGRNVILPH
jgi:hypothetical protein